MSRQDDIQKLIFTNERRRQILRDQLASFGPLHAPAYLLIEIEDVEREISLLNRELDALKNEETQPADPEAAGRVPDKSGKSKIAWDMWYGLPDQHT